MSNPVYDKEGQGAIHPGNAQGLYHPDPDDASDPFRPAEKRISQRRDTMWNCVNNSGTEVVEEGLKYVHKRHLLPRSAGHRPDDFRPEKRQIRSGPTRLIITQTGGGCRAFN